MELGIKGKRAVVTGAGQGIGRETALVLAQEGGVVCVSDINDSRGKETVEEICERGGNWNLYSCGCGGAGGDQAPLSDGCRAVGKRGYFN